MFPVKVALETLGELGFLAGSTKADAVAAGRVVRTMHTQGVIIS